MSIPFILLAVDKETAKMILLVVIGVVCVIVLIVLYLKAERKERLRLQQKTEDETLDRLSAVKLHQKLNDCIGRLDRIESAQQRLLSLSSLSSLSPLSSRSINSGSVSGTTT